jgi:hypothetical protein
MIPFLGTFDTTPSPHRRINAPRSLLAFAHIHGEAGTLMEGIGVAFLVLWCFGFMSEKVLVSEQFSPTCLILIIGGLVSTKNK